MSSNTLTRRSMVAASAGAMGFPWIAKAAGPEFKYKFGHDYPETHPTTIRAREVAAKIKEETDGRLEINVFPNNQLGSDPDMLSQLRAGGLEFFALSGNILSTLIPAAAINAVGFAFPDYPAVWKAMDGALGAYVRGQINKANIMVLDKIWDNGFRQTTSSSKPIASVEDFRDFKIRVPAAPVSTSLFKALGASPTTINLNEVYSALQTKIVLGQENPLALISTGKYYEVQKYCSLTSHIWDGAWFLMNRRAWERLPTKIQEIAARNLNAAALVQRSDTEMLNANLQKELAAKGMVINKPDLAPFREKLRSAGFYAEWKSKFGEEAWALLEASVGKLA